LSERPEDGASPRADEPTPTPINPIVPDPPDVIPQGSDQQPTLAPGEDGFDNVVDQSRAESAGASNGAIKGDGRRDGGHRERVGKASFAITGFTALGRVLGFLEAWLVARFFGGGSISGSYFAAGTVVWNIFGFGEQLLTHSFLPPFVESKEKRGEESAWKLASIVGIIQILVLLLVVGLAELFARQLVGWITHGFTTGEMALTTHLLRIMLPAAIVMSVASLTYVVLNAYKEFALPAFADTALKAGIVIGGFALWRWIGIDAFAIGLVLGGCIKLAVHLFGLRPRLRLLRWSLDVQDPAFKKLLILMVPLMLGNLLSSVRPVLDIYFSGASSQVAALKFATKLTNLPFLLIPYALAIALFPFLAEMATRGDRRRLGQALLSALQMITFLMVPITVVYIMLAHPMVETVYLGGKFTASDAGRVVGPLVWSSLGMLPLGIETVILQIYFSMSDTKTPTIIAYGTFVVYLLVAYFGTRYFLWGATGVALAFTASKTVKDFILVGVLAPRLEGLDLKGLVSFIARMAVATFVMIVVLWATLKFVYHRPETTLRPMRAAAATSAVTIPTTTNPSITSPVGGKTGTHPVTTKKPKKSGSKRKAVIIFLACAAPALFAFALAAYWLKIAELQTVLQVLERRLWPLIRRLIMLAMAPW